MRTTVDDAVRQIAAHGHVASAGPLSVAPDDFGAFYGQVRSERLDGLLLRMWRDGNLDLTEDRANVFAGAHRDEMEQVLRLERAALQVAELLSGAGIRALFLKGIVLANTVYADPAWRSFGDVDVLVEPARIVAAIEVLMAAGAQRELPEVRPGFDARFAKDVPLLVDGMTVDLHRTLIQGPFGERIPVPSVVERRRPFQLGGRALDALDATDAYVLAAMTAGAADVPARLMTLRDLLELERSGDFDGDEVVSTAMRWGVAAAVARGLEVLADQLPADRPPALLSWAQRLLPTRRDRFYMGCYTSSARSYRSTLATLAALPNWSDRVALAHALLLPQRDYRRARGWTRVEHLRRGVTKLRR